MPPSNIFPPSDPQSPFSTAAYAQTDAPASPGKTGACRPSKSRYPVSPYISKSGGEKRQKKKTHRLQPLLDLAVQRAALEGDHGRRLGVVRDRRPALGAEPPVHGVARVGGAFPLLDGARRGELVLGDDDDEGW